MDLLYFKELLEKDHIYLTKQQLDLFDIYAKYLIEYNQKINLTTISNYQDIIDKHFYDSIIPFINIDPNIHLCDIGSGAGFPSIPLKIVYPNLTITIIEPIKKRCLFLNNLINLLKLKDVTIINDRAELHSKIGYQKYDIVTARAVAKLNILCELCIPLVKVQGLFIALKAKEGHIELQQASNAIKVLGCKLKQIKEIKTNNYQRTNIYIIKVSNTNKIYPRIYPKIKSNPL